MRGGCLLRGAAAYIPYIYRTHTHKHTHILSMVYIRYMFYLHTVYTRSATSLHMGAPDKFLFKKYNGITNGPGFFLIII